MKEKTKHNSLGILLIVTTLIGTILIGGYIFFLGGDYWTPYNEFDGGMSVFLFWLNTILLTIGIYAFFRIFDTLLNTSPEKQEQLRQTYIQTLAVITLFFGVFLLFYLIIGGYNLWKQQEYQTPFQLIIIIIKLFLGVFIKAFFFIYSLILQLVRESLSTVNMTVSFFDKQFTIGNNDTIDQLVTIAVMFILFQRRHLIISFFTGLLKVVEWIRNLLFGSNPEAMKNGIIGILNRTFLRSKKFILSLLGFKQKEETSRGSADFASPLEEYDILNIKQKGLVIDGDRSLGETMSDRHIMVMAPTGQGKTTNYVIPNLLSCVKGEKKSFIITDPKGDIHQSTSGYMKSIGYKVRIIDLTNPNRSRTFNPLERTFKNGKLSDKEVARVAEIMVDARNKDEGGGGNPFFSNSAKMFLTTLIKVLAYGDRKHYNLHNLHNLVSMMGKTGEGILPLVVENTRTDKQELSPKEIQKRKQLRQEFISFLTKNDETVASIIMTIQSSIKDLAIEEIQQLTATDTINFEDIREKNVAIYIITPPSEVSFFRFYLTLFYSQLFNYCEASMARKEKAELDQFNRIYFLMDEFGNLGKIPDFQQIITTLRSAKCSVSMIVQDIDQIKTVYGNQGASAIIYGGCASKLVFGAIQNQSILKEVSLLMGKKTIKENRGGQQTLIGRDLMTPDEISRMPIGTALLLSAGKRPVKLKLTQWEDHTTLKTRKRAKVLEPENPITIEYIDYSPEENDTTIQVIERILDKDEKIMKALEGVI